MKVLVVCTGENFYCDQEDANSLYQIDDEIKGYGEIIRFEGVK